MPAGVTHFMGIGGIGMSGLAAVLLSRGEKVSGCDAALSSITARLQQAGAQVWQGHDPSHLTGVTRVVVSDAIRPDNPELVQARNSGLDVLRRSQVLGQIMSEARGIAVAGSHGKTTVTAMVALILQVAGMDPTVLLGGELDAIGGNARAGHGEWVVAEACEAYNSFLDLEPEVAVLTNVEADHLDFHGTVENLRKAFGQFVSRVKLGGALVWCSDREELGPLLATAACCKVSYSLVGEADFAAQEVSLEGFGSRYRVRVPGGGSQDMRLCVPGLYNVSNALGAAACAWQTGISMDVIAGALAEFRGVKRRFERVGEVKGVTVVDDYAHHPTEIRATLATARGLCQGRLAAVFQPHLFSRTRDLLHGFARSFADADAVVIAEIYPAREDPIPGVAGALLAERIRLAEPGKEVEFIAEKERIAERLVGRLQPGDWVVALGAGDVYAVAHDLVRLLSA